MRLRFCIGLVAVALIGLPPATAFAGAAPAGDEADEERGVTYRLGSVAINLSFDAGFGAFSATSTGSGSAARASTVTAAHAAAKAAIREPFIVPSRSYRYRPRRRERSLTG